MNDWLYIKLMYLNGSDLVTEVCHCEDRIMNDCISIRQMSLGVVTGLLKDFHCNHIKVTDINDWLDIKLIGYSDMTECLGIRLVCMRVVRWQLKDLHEIEV